MATDPHHVTLDHGARPSHDTIRHLPTHPDPYVTASALARYWQVRRQRIYTLIEDGSLHAIRLGPRLLLIRTNDAIRFEQRGGAL
jgi:hypothetical protein